MTALFATHSHLLAECLYVLKGIPVGQECLLVEIEWEHERQRRVNVTTDLATFPQSRDPKRERKRTYDDT